MTAATDQARRPAAAPPGQGAAASHWLRPLVIGPGQPVRVVGVSGPACYLAVDGGTVVALEAAGAGAGLPNALSLDAGRPGVDDLVTGARGQLGGGALRVHDRVVTVRRWWDPRPRTPPVEPSRLRWRRAELPLASPALAGHGLAGPVDELRAAARRVDARTVASLVDELVGRGPGSTPAGDDVLAGMLATLRVLGGAHAGAIRVADALGGAVRAAAPRTSALSATLLRCADVGAVVDAARRVLEALPGDSLLAGPVARLVRLGHTSGHDLLIGIGIAVDLLTIGRDRT
ncbi:MAG TPA: DUF2877 domain-containing protein [Euzebyales bacterium]|nr:DUF2877 domain-containing protein [Euzebyales bacterium]